MDRNFCSRQKFEIERFEIEREKIGSFGGNVQGTENIVRNK